MMQPGSDEDESVTPMEQGTVDLLNSLHSMARPEAVFAAPVAVGDRVVIAVAEVAFGVGVVFGGGTGAGRSSGDKGVTSPGQGKGVGGGGGGGGLSRPVAVVVVGPDGVSVKPVVDASKILLACLTLGLTVALEAAKARRRRRSAD